MDNTILLAIIGIAEAVITALVTFFLTKKKYNTEVDSNIITNMKESLEFYKQLSDDNRERLEEVLKGSSKLKDDMIDMQKQLVSLWSYICTETNCQMRKIDPEVCPYYRKVNIEETEE